MKKTIITVALLIFSASIVCAQDMTWSEFYGKIQLGLTVSIYGAISPNTDRSDLIHEIRSSDTNNDGFVFGTDGNKVFVLEYSMFHVSGQYLFVALSSLIDYPTMANERLKIYDLTDINQRHAFLNAINAWRDSVVKTTSNRQQPQTKQQQPQQQPQTAAQPSQPQTQVQPPQSTTAPAAFAPYQGTWSLPGEFFGLIGKGHETIVITNNTFRYYNKDGFDQRLTIDSWEAVSNTNSKTRGNFPSGYLLTGHTDRGDNMKYYIYLHNNRQRLIYGQMLPPGDTPWIFEKQ